MNNTILTIDQGTTNTKVHLVGKDGSLHHKFSRPVSQQYPKPGWIEQDATELWQSVVLAVRDCLEASGGVKPAGIAIHHGVDLTYGQLGHAAAEISILDTLGHGLFCG